MNSLIPIGNFKEYYASILLISIKPILFRFFRIKFLRFRKTHFAYRNRLSKKRMIYKLNSNRLYKSNGRIFPLSS
ncbi:hypothetical protein BV917_16290 [Leptospira santarosai serovar Guaricura]|nr:hypothetical protein BV917_16290 [Leptospira santarosai serovar Guaricura]